MNFRSVTTPNYKQKAGRCIVTAVTLLTTALPRVRAAGEGLHHPATLLPGEVRTCTLGGATLQIRTEITEIIPRSQNTFGLAAEAGPDPGLPSMIGNPPLGITSHSTMRT